MADIVDQPEVMNPDLGEPSSEACLPPIGGVESAEQVLGGAGPVPDLMSEEAIVHVAKETNNLGNQMNTLEENNYVTTQMTTQPQKVVRRPNYVRNNNCGDCNCNCKCSGQDCDAACHCCCLLFCSWVFIFKICTD
ncbi:unnamed protein product [Moneuplotes crassus]|uniref:Uncharacterized protein n=1 Tax=Euplotes crassus TaxID=5936 RepID=A0AAD1XXW0_EUPCR|nr:unnamed protein product [Moneuplotes crassus]